MGRTSSTEQSKRTQTLWKTCLTTASRTALACTIVASITLFGPSYIHQQVAFPAFSYVSLILIITNAALGDTLRGCWFAISATLQAICPAILYLSIVGPTRLSAPSTALVVGIAGFFITLPESTHIVAKRIALGQLIIVYVIGYINGERTHPVMHPVHVAISTAVGALACVLAFLFPYPGLAYSQVKENSKLFAENASARLQLFVKAFGAEDSASSEALICQAKCLAAEGKKFLQRIKYKQESMHWERFPIKFLRPYCKNPGDRFQEIETPLKGMEIALTNMKPPVLVQDNEQLKEGMSIMEGQICQNLEQFRSHLPCEGLTVPESDAELDMSIFHPLQNPPSEQTDLPSYFFLFCMKLLCNQSKAMTSFPNKPKGEKKSNTIQNPNHHDQPNGSFFKRIRVNWPETLTKKRLIPPLKLSLSLGFAVLFGLYYSKPDGYWAGLPVAITVATAREPTFKVTNAKAQGTVLGTVYGVLGCFLFERFVQIRFIALLPWFIFTSFLQQSKMYGQAGGVSAAIGAVLILGRKNFGEPSEFAIARIMETFIGLSCSVIVELLLQPTRAATLSKAQLSKTLASLEGSLSLIDLRALSKEKLLERQRVLKKDVTELGKYISEAEVEPNFWFLPFQSGCYGKLLSSLSKVSDILLFMAHAIGSLEGQIQNLEQMGCKQEVDKINGDLELVGKITASSIKDLSEITSIKSLTKLEKDLAKNNKSYDLELGKSGRSKLNLDAEEVKKTISSFLEHVKEVFDNNQNEDFEDAMKSEMVLSLSALGFCLSSLMKETREIEKGIRETVQWENSISHVNLNEILCKIHALKN